MPLRLKHIIFLRSCSFVSGSKNERQSTEKASTGCWTNIGLKSLPGIIKKGASAMVDSNSQKDWYPHVTIERATTACFFVATFPQTSILYFLSYLNLSCFLMNPNTLNCDLFKNTDYLIDIIIIKLQDYNHIIYNLKNCLNS